MTDPTKPASPRRRRFASRGAAYTETVVMLPFFAAVWACMIYVHKAYSTKLDVMEQSRSCVWRYAFEGCQSTPPGCSPSTSPLTGAGADGGHVSSLAGMLGPIGGPLLSALTGSQARVRSTGTAPRPRVLGSGGTSIAAENTMMCNTVRQTLPSMARAVFCGFTGLC